MSCSFKFSMVCVSWQHTTPKEYYVWSSVAFPRLRMMVMLIWKKNKMKPLSHNGGNEFAKEPFGDVKVCHLGGYNANVWQKHKHVRWNVPMSCDLAGKRRFKCYARESEMTEPRIFTKDNLLLLHFSF